LNSSYTALNSQRGLWNRDFVATCLSSFFLFLTFYVLAVTLPVFVTDTLHGGMNQIGLVTTVFMISTVLFRPIAGVWLDRFNRRKIMFFSLALFMGSAALYPFIHQFYTLLGLRFLQGIGFGIAATATGAIAVELVPVDRKGEGVGYFSLFMSLAMVVGPFVGLRVMELHNDNLLFGMCFVCALLSFVCGISVRIPAYIHVKKEAAAKGWRRFIEIGAIPISITGSLLAFSYGSITTFLSVYAKQIGLSSFASYFFIVFALMIVLSRPFTGRLFDRSGPNILVYPGIILFAIGMIGLSVAHTSTIFLISAGVIGLGFGALLPSYQTIAIQSSAPHRGGMATGTYFLMFDSGYAIGSYALGVVAAQTSYRVMYLITAIVVACSAAVYYGLYHRRSRLQQS
jgi:MFS family permease